jgi:hypothetical protein
MIWLSLNFDCFMQNSLYQENSTFDHPFFQGGITAANDSLGVKPRMAPMGRGPDHCLAQG